MAVSEIISSLKNSLITYKFGYHLAPTNLPKYQDFLNFAKHSDNKYINPKFCELWDQVAYTDLISNTYLISIKGL